jgi:hypothetical protein
VSRDAGFGIRDARVLVLVAGAVLVAGGCGKKGDPEPPLPKGPNAVSNLTVDQEGDDAVLTFAFPDRLLTGAPLTDLYSIEVYRVVNAPPSLTTPRRAGEPQPAAAGGGTTTTMHLPGQAERRAATNVRVAEEAFYGLSRKVAVLSIAAIADLTHGASVVYRDPLTSLLEQEHKPSPLAYAVVSVRRGGERSPLSNIVTLTPDVALGAPTLLEAFPEEGRVCLEWTPPDTDMLGRPIEVTDVGGYVVYRRTLPQEEFETPLNAKPIAADSFVDGSAPYDLPLVYTVRAVLAKNPRVEGLPAEELPVVYHDIYPPPAPTQLDALSEATRVRLVWSPVTASDLAGYLVFRAAGEGPPAKLTATPLIDPFFTDEDVAPGTRYRYVVRAVDRAGNQSPPSPEAVAEVY